MDWEEEGFMIFKLTTSKYFFTDEEKVKYEKMGFTFVPIDESFQIKEWKKDESKLPTIIFDSIANLEVWWKEMHVECTLIIDFEDKEIEIYDDYRE